MTDTLSSFEPEIYRGKRNFLEKPNLTGSESAGSSKLENSANPYSIELPFYHKKLYAFMYFVFIVTSFASMGPVVALFLSRNNSTLSTTPIAITQYILFMVMFFILIILPGLLLFSKEKIVIADDSIILIRRYLWGTRVVFRSHFNELEDITLIPA